MDFTGLAGGQTLNKREEIAAARHKAWPSVNALAAPLLRALIDDADALPVDVTHGAPRARSIDCRGAAPRGSLGDGRIDCGVRALGGLEAGRRMAEICLGGLGKVALETTDTDS